MKVKFCGMTNLEDAEKAIELGVDYLGFIVDFPGTPRNLTIDQFFELAKKIKNKNRQIKIVAVTVDMEDEKINKLIESKLVDVLQFHGNEGVEYCSKYKDRIEVWKSFKPVGRSQEFEDYNSFINNIKKFKDKVRRFNIDASSAQDKERGEYKTFSNFDLYRELEGLSFPLILAGGLNPENIEEFIIKLNPEIVDVASGIEEYPGKKSFDKMEKFMKIITKYK